MTEISVTITGDKEVLAHLRKVGNGVINLRQPMSEIGRDLTGFFSGQVFASRGGIIGESWAKLSPAYARYKAKTYPGRPPLVRTGEMQRSFKSRATATSVEVYNTAKHFDYHQLGTRKMPARVMMKVDEPRLKAIHDTVDRYVQSLVGAA